MDYCKAYSRIVREAIRESKSPREAYHYAKNCVYTAFDGIDERVGHIAQCAGVYAAQNFYGKCNRQLHMFTGTPTWRLALKKGLKR